MADAAQARSDDASRNGAPRSAIVEYLRLAEEAGTYFEKAEKAKFIDRNQNVGPKVDDTARKAWVAAYQQVMYLQPNSAADMLLLAAHTAVMAEQLEMFHEDGREEDASLLNGIHMALESIAAFLARDLGTDVVDAASRELGRSTRIIMNIDAERRAERASSAAEGQ